MNLLLPTLSLLLTLTSPITAASDVATDTPTTKSYKCSLKNLILWRQIDSFCQKAPFQIPSTIAKNGAQAPPYGTGPNKINSLKITGPCNPPQRVSKDVCKSQFYEVCAGGGPRGGGVRFFGRGGCQAWTLTASSTAPKLKLTPSSKKRDVEENGDDLEVVEAEGSGEEEFADWWEAFTEGLEPEEDEVEAKKSKLRRSMEKLMGRGVDAMDEVEGGMKVKKRGPHDGPHVHEP